MKRPRFTWWGGVLGAKLLNHAVCGDCGLGFNAKSRRSNRTAISLYLGMLTAIMVLMIVMRLAEV